MHVCPVCLTAAISALWAAKKLVAFCWMRRILNATPQTTADDGRQGAHDE